MNHRAKFKCLAVIETEDGKKTRLIPCSNADQEEEFFNPEIEPEGVIEIGAIGPLAGVNFRPGHFYYVEFIEAAFPEEPPQSDSDEPKASDSDQAV